MAKMTNTEFNDLIVEMKLALTKYDIPVSVRLDNSNYNPDMHWVCLTIGHKVAPITRIVYDLMYCEIDNNIFVLMTLANNDFDTNETITDYQREIIKPWVERLTKTSTNDVG